MSALTEVAKYNGSVIAKWGGTATSFRAWGGRTEGGHVKFGMAEWTFPVSATEAYYMNVLAMDAGFYTKEEYDAFKAKFGRPFLFDFSKMSDEEKAVQVALWAKAAPSGKAVQRAGVIKKLSLERRLAFTVLKQGIDTTKIDRKYFNECHGPPAMLMAMMRYLAAGVVTRGVDGLDIRAQFNEVKWTNAGNFVAQVIAFDKVLTLFQETLLRHEPNFHVTDTDKHVMIRQKRPTALKGSDRDIRKATNYDEGYQILLVEARVVDKEHGVQPVLFAGTEDVSAFYLAEPTKFSKGGASGGAKSDGGAKPKYKVVCAECGGGHTIYKCTTESAKKLTSVEKREKVDAYLKKQRGGRKTLALAATTGDTGGQETTKVQQYTFSQASGLYLPAKGKIEGKNMFKFDHDSASYVPSMVLFPIFEQQQLVLGVVEDATAQQRMERALAAKSSGGWMQDQEFVDSGVG